MLESLRLLLRDIGSGYGCLVLRCLNVSFGRVNMSGLHRIILGLMLWFVATGSFAHQTGNSYLYLQQADGQLKIDLDFYVRDLGNLLQKPGAEPEPAPPPEKSKRYKLRSRS